MQRVSVLKMSVTVASCSEVVSKVSEWISGEDKSKYICVSNVHMCMEVFDSLEYRHIVNSADVVVADGLPISVGQRMLGAHKAVQVRGEDLMLGLCGLAQEKGYKIGFFGSSEKTLLQLSDALAQLFSQLEMPIQISPPFRDLSEEENSSYRESIRNAQVDILFVGLGCPKQERWMAQNFRDANCTMVGVGAAFDFISGNKARAPIWMQRSGLEWVHRLLDEPSRLWRRYLINNPRFLFRFSIQYFKSKF